MLPAAVGTPRRRRCCRSILLAGSQTDRQSTAEVAMSGALPRSIQVRYLDQLNRKDVVGQAVFQARTVLVVFDDGSQALLPYDGCQVAYGGASRNLPMMTLLADYNHYVRLVIEERQIADRLDRMMPADLRATLIRMARR